MAYYWRLLTLYIRTSMQQEMTFRFHFFVSLLFSLLNLGTGALGLVILFQRVATVHGWTLASGLVLLGVFQILVALRGLVFGPSLEGLADEGGEIDSGRFDFILLRPVQTQFLVSLRNWRLFSLLDVVLGAGMMTVGLVQMRQVLTWQHLLAFVVAIAAGITILYAMLLAFSALAFWNPRFSFNWAFNDLFQLARYPAALYPGWLRLVITWVLPVGFMTTIPAEAVSGELSPGELVGSVVFALALLVGASLLFRSGLRRYTSASS